MRHEQLITRNISELADLVVSFHELSETYSWLHLIQDHTGFMLLDLRIGKVLFYYPFKHFKDMAAEMRSLQRDIVKCSVANSRYNINQRLKTPEYWSVKRIANLFGHEDRFFFDEPLYQKVFNKNGNK